MVLGRSARGLQQSLFTPIAKAFLAIGLTPNAVTLIGTILTSIAALTLFPLGFLTIGSLVLGVLVLTDSIDGIMARLSGTSGPYGEFLDSSLDRLSDAAIFAGVTLWFVFQSDGWIRAAGVAGALACLAFGAAVPYVRAKAEAIGVKASVGIAERADRILVLLLATFVTGLGVPVIVLPVALGVLALLSLITVIQRITFTRAALESRDD